MKYHQHTLKKISVDLGYDDEKENYLWNIYDENGELIGTEPCLNAAKEVVDYGEAVSYL